MPSARRWALWAAVPVVLLVLLAAAPLWLPAGATVLGWVVVLSSAVLGAITFLLFLHALRESSATTHALDEFAQHLREGDVGGALRAVRAESVMPADSTHASSLPSGSWPAISRFGSVAREVEGVLGERERRWQSRMRLSADWHWETDDQLRFTWVSRDLASLVKLGVQPADLIGRRIDEVSVFAAPDDGWAGLVERMTHHRALRDVVLEVRRPGRMSVWVVLNGRAHRDGTGTFVGYEGVGRDITEQRLAYLKLAESERRHALMAELSVDWYWQTDTEHRIDQFGQVAKDLLGERATEALGMTRWDLHPDGATDAEWAAHRADLDARRSFRGFDYAVRQPGRGLRWISIGGQPRFDARGEFVGYHGVGRDITLRKRAERVLLNRNQALERLVTERTAELEQSNRDLEAFSRQLAHELRTPIGQVAGLADLLKSRLGDRLADDEREWLRLQGQAAREMSHTLTALLELARSASTALLLEAVDLSALAQAVIDDLPWLERKAPVDWFIEPGMYAHCSAALARVALSNLLGNAAKFTRDVAAPRVEFRRHNDLAGVADGSFAVSDNGAGFDAERAATLFQPFVRLHRSDQFQGTGLGLSIVRRIVERHGGGIAASAEAGRGARFVFRFGAAQAQAQLPSDDARIDGLSDAAA